MKKCVYIVYIDMYRCTAYIEIRTCICIGATNLCAYVYTYIQKYIYIYIWCSVDQPPPLPPPMVEGVGFTV